MKQRRGTQYLSALLPHGLGLRLHAHFSRKDDNCAIQHAQRSLHFHGEVHVARRVYDVDLVVFPEARDSRCRDGDAALFFLLHPVCDGFALVHSTDLVDQTGIKEDAFGCCGLTRIDVRSNAHIP